MVKKKRQNTIKTRQDHHLSLSLSPRRQSVTEVQYHGNQTLSRQWEARMLLQRFLSGAILHGVLEPQLPPRAPQIIRSQPTSPPLLGVRASKGFMVEVHCTTMPRRSTVGVADLPPLGTTEVGFNKVSRSLGRALALEAQRG